MFIVPINYFTFLYRIDEEYSIEEISIDDENSDDDDLGQIPDTIPNVQSCRWTSTSSSDKEDKSKKKYHLTRKIKELRPELEKQKQGMKKKINNKVIVILYT